MAGLTAAVRNAWWSLLFSIGLALLAACGVDRRGLNAIADAWTHRRRRDAARARGRNIIVALLAVALVSSSCTPAPTAQVVPVHPHRELAPCPAGTAPLYVDHLHARRVCGQVAP